MRSHRTFHNRRPMNGTDEQQGGQSGVALKPRQRASRRTSHVNPGRAMHFADVMRIVTVTGESNSSSDKSRNYGKPSTTLAISSAMRTKGF